MRPALGLALLLVLQLAFAGLASGAAASLPPLDAYGNPICAGGTDQSRHDGGGQGHGSMPACCQTGCPMAGGAILIPPGTAGAEAPRRLALDAGGGALRAFEPAGKGAWRPGNPRAPPAA